MGNKRIAMIDNLRALLMILVVLGHVLERIGFPGRDALYYGIYSFHMPAMVFLSGLCFRRNSTRLWKTTVLPYLVFQPIYLAEKAWETGAEFSLQFSTPSWILWYMLSLALWQMVTNLIDLRQKPWLPLGISVLCAVLVGFDKYIGYLFSLSRTIAFFPFFLAGAWIYENGYETFLSFFSGRKSAGMCALLAAPALITQLLLYRQTALCKSYFFYFAQRYDDVSTLWVRLMVFVTAVAAIIALCLAIPKKELPLLSRIGRNTLPVYLLHGVLLRIITHLGWLKKLPFSKPMNAFLLTAIFVLLLASAPVTAVFDWLFFSGKSAGSTQQGKMNPSRRRSK